MRQTLCTVRAGAHLRVRFAMMALYGVLTACGGGGSASPPPPPPMPFTFNSATPADSATSVPRGAAITASFSDTVDARTVSATTLQLAGPGGIAIPITPSSSAMQVQLAQAGGGLPGNTKYTVTLAAGLASVSGQTLGAARGFSFTTVAQNWDANTTDIAAMTYFTSGVRPVAAVDKAGNVTLAWRQSVGALGDLMVSRRDVKSGAWSSPVRLSPNTSGTGDVNSISLLADAGSGDVYLFWNQYSFGGSNAMQLMRYGAATNSWQPVATAGLMPAGATGDGARMATIDAVGVITFVVRAYGPSVGPTELFATRLDTKSGVFAQPQRLSTPSAYNYFLGQDAVTDSAGNVTVAWVQDYQLYAVRYDAAKAAWGTATLMEPGLLTGLFSMFSLAVDGKGVPTLAWARNSGALENPSAYVARLDPATGQWGTATLLSGASSAGTDVPQLVADTGGNTTVLWQQFNGLNSARFAAGAAAWSAPQQVPGVAISPVTGYSTVVDVAGNIMVVFVSASVRQQAVQYLATDGLWHAPVTMDAPIDGQTVFSDQAALVVDPSGSVTAAWFSWTQYANVSHYAITANRFY